MKESPTLGAFGGGVADRTVRPYGQIVASITWVRVYQFEFAHYIRRSDSDMGEFKRSHGVLVVKDRRDIGQVEFLIDKFMAARALSSCGAGQEVMLETNRGLELNLRCSLYR